MRTNYQGDLVQAPKQYAKRKKKNKPHVAKTVVLKRIYNLSFGKVERALWCLDNLLVPQTIKEFEKLNLDVVDIIFKDKKQAYTKKVILKRYEAKRLEALKKRSKNLKAEGKGKRYDEVKEPFVQENGGKENVESFKHEEEALYGKRKRRNTVNEMDSKRSKMVKEFGEAEMVGEEEMVGEDIAESYQYVDRVISRLPVIYDQDTSFYFIDDKYKFVFVIDISESMTVLDMVTGSRLLDIALET
ncbi:hypothetical protein AX774_g1403 [Zancudomyces culisetae]|uniref:Uncharacterized protein n=1 Tax=Zancudomyces culisetae TaxID=1213189 RepID=A0A1R1PVS8_ZANCU|nr:hypothetical protein AX774_g1403 [Zancudomyces culisetae]|eukprot:OMH85077.1 hypothetical protein AX774_g1403 [Zancudomyces culisetae]